jgi:hypothetical protein
MPSVGFEPAIPASERPKTHALDGAATGIGEFYDDINKYSVFIKDVDYYDELRNYRLLKRDCIPWSQLLYTS